MQLLLPQHGMFAVTAITLALLSSTARAQYNSGFENLDIAPTVAHPYAPAMWDASAPLGTWGQDGYYWPSGTSFPFDVQAYTGGVAIPGINDYGIPNHPCGGGQFIVGNGPGSPAFARAQRDISYGSAAGTWTWSTELCITYAGILPTAQNCGSFSVQPFPGSQSFIALARWSDVNTATNWDADYVWFDAAGTQMTVSVTDPAFQNLNVMEWYRWETTADLSTNQILEVRITNLTAGTATVSHNPAGAYMLGGTLGSTSPTGFRFFAGGGVADNVIAWDNLAIYPGTPTAAFTEVGDAGDLPGTRQCPAGFGPLDQINGDITGIDVDMYLIYVCDVANFTASTVGGASFDTQMFMFAPNGMGISFKDDDVGTLQSTLTGQFLTGPGPVLLAISKYSNDPEDSGNGELWLDAPYNVERQPDGLGAANPVHHWDGSATAGGSYSIALTGAEYMGSTHVAAYMESGTGCGLTLTCDALPVSGRSFDFTLAGVPAGGIGAALAQFGQTGPGVPQPTPPFAAGCTRYLGANPVSLGLIFSATHQYSIAIPTGPAFLGIQIGVQGAAADFSSGLLVTLSNALDGRIGDR